MSLVLGLAFEDLRSLHEPAVIEESTRDELLGLIASNPTDVIFGKTVPSYDTICANPGEPATPNTASTQTIRDMIKLSRLRKDAVRFGS